jgi:hydroxymethylpyrimidine pyrophosphatase-like HAD family hydrolase
MNKEVEEYITKNYYELLSISKKVTRGHELSQELLHEVLLQLMEKKCIKLKKYDDNNIKYYITAIIKINWISRTSPFFYRIRKERITYQELKYDMEIIDTQQEDFERQQLFDILEQEFTELDWFKKSLMEMYLTLGSLKKVSTKTQIPLTSIARYIKESKTQIRDNVKKNIEK